MTTRQSIDPNRLTLEQASKLLSAAAKKQVPQEYIETDIADGAPTNTDGTLNLVHYTAWIVKEMGNG